MILIAIVCGGRLDCERFVSKVHVYTHTQIVGFGSVDQYLHTSTVTAAASKRSDDIESYCVVVEPPSLG